MSENKSIIGIIGGGQLGKMLIESTQEWDTVKYVVLDPSDNPICNKYCEIIKGDLNDKMYINKLIEKSDIITYEIENINTDALLTTQSSCDIIPYPNVLETIKNKYKQKEFLKLNNIPTANFMIITNNNKSNILELLNNNGKIILKNCTGGYDGNGVQVITKNNVSLLENINVRDTYIVEEFINCKKELAITVAIDREGNYVTYPVVETVFNNNNTLDYQLCPANIKSNIGRLANETAIKTALAFNSPGLFAIELFLTQTNNILVNEVSPRPHNTGHHTIECAVTSQFEQLNRILLGLPLGDTTITCPSLMKNILGPEHFTGSYDINMTDNSIYEKGVFLHMYGKKVSRPNRKLGHVTITGNDLIRKKNHIMNIISIDPNTDTRRDAPLVGVIMGSISDNPVMKDCCKILDDFGIPYEKHIVSAHRTPENMFNYAKNAHSNGLKIIIAGAGGAAHLPGMCASLTTLPVIGVPIKTSALSGVDSLHSIVQMPRGVPVATVAINGSINAALLAIKILAINNSVITDKLHKYMNDLKDKVAEMEHQLHNN